MRLGKCMNNVGVMKQSPYLSQKYFTFWGCLCKAQPSNDSLFLIVEVSVQDYFPCRIPMTELVPRGTCNPGHQYFLQSRASQILPSWSTPPSGSTALRYHRQTWSSPKWEIHRPRLSSWPLEYSHCGLDFRIRTVSLQYLKSTSISNTFHGKEISMCNMF